MDQHFVVLVVYTDEPVTPDIMAQRMTEAVH